MSTNLRSKRVSAVIRVKGKPKSKYLNKPTVVDDIRFDSKKEAEYYLRLKDWQELGEVLYFLRQVPIHLPGGVTMRIDFLVFWKDGSHEFIDVKGKDRKTGKFRATQDWTNKRKIAESIYPIKIGVA